MSVKRLRWVFVAAALALVAGAGGVLVLRLPARPPGEAADGPRARRRQAEEALRAHDFAGACAHLRKCLEWWPAHAETHFLLARACRRADDAAGWEEHLHAAEVLQWSPKEVRFERQLMQAQSGDLAPVEAGLAGRLESGGEDVLILEALTKGSLKAVRLADALRGAALWAERDPGDWQPALYRGRAEDLNGAPDRAVADYRLALAIKPDHRAGRLWLAGALVRTGAYAEARTEFDRCVAGEPEGPDGWRGIARCELALGKTDAAAAALDRLLALRPDDPGGLLLRGRLELARGAPAEALAWLRKAERAAPGDPDVLEGLVSAGRRLGRADEAGGYEKRLEAARADARRLEEVRGRALRSPEAAGPRYEAGVLCLRLGRPEEARDWLTAALILDPGHGPTHEALADCYERLGDADRAAYHRHMARRKGS